MKFKEVELGEKKFKINEILYLDIVELGSIENKRSHALKLLELSGLKEEDIKNLTIQEGQVLVNAINELNGFNQDFQKTSSQDENK